MYTYVARDFATAKIIDGLDLLIQLQTPAMVGNKIIAGGFIYDVIEIGHELEKSCIEKSTTILYLTKIM